ncbi:hypothetical protein MG293_001447 [Ovis ammon polii]|uniref:Uncharacterized protein n=1 Tax=Ovis ammon polii TaxID=230172 RepID=A0AAD4YIW1_OVIAM|nr:hypothetical protein MG293_001447 [Ovis ammon polii]
MRGEPGSQKHSELSLTQRSHDPKCKRKKLKEWDTSLHRGRARGSYGGAKSIVIGEKAKTDILTTQGTQGPVCLPMDQTQWPQLGPFCPWSPPDADNWPECPDWNPGGIRKLPWHTGVVREEAECVGAFSTTKLNEFVRHAERPTKRTIAGGTQSILSLRHAAQPMVDTQQAIAPFDVQSHQRKRGYPSHLRGENF